MRSINAKYNYGYYYSKYHNEDSSHVAKAVENQQAFLSEHLSRLCQGKALDIGSGMGFTALALAKMGFNQVTGIDIDQGQIEASRRQGVDAYLVDDSIAFLNDNRNNYSCITMLDVLEHIEVKEQLETLQAVYQALEPGGRVLIQVPNATFILASRWRYNDFTHYSSFTEYSLHFLLANAGFGQIHIPPSKPVYRPSMWGMIGNRTKRAAFRQQMRRWLVRSFWVHVLQAELPFEDVSTICFDPNIVATAIRSE
jgi:SAM-dependent methyltransferase